MQVIRIIGMILLFILLIVLVVLYYTIATFERAKAKELTKQNNLLVLNNDVYKKKIDFLEKEIIKLSKVEPLEAIEAIEKIEPIKILNVKFKSNVSKEKIEETLKNLDEYIHKHGMVAEDPNYIILPLEYTPNDTITFTFSEPGINFNIPNKELEKE